MLFYSSFQQSYVWLPLIGLGVGMLSSMIGSGGGFFFPVVLILFFQVPAHIAVATSLAASLPLCVAGLWAHYRHGNVNLTLGLVFGIAGVLGALAGVVVAQLLSPVQLKMVFGFYSILLAVLVFLNNGDNKKCISVENLNPGLSQSKFLSGLVYGLAGGIISGTFGTSGSAPVLAGLMAMRTPLRVVAGTSLLVVFFNTLTALAGHFLVGEIDMTLMLLLTIGSVLGAFAGTKLLVKLKPGKSEPRIRQLFAIVILIFGVILILA